MADLVLSDLRKEFGQTEAVRGLNLAIQDGEFFCLLGPSGCGKTTVLRMVAGFEHPTSGSIRIGGVDATPLPPHEREVGMVFQQYALFPHMTVQQNLLFGLRMHRVPNEESARRLEDALSLLSLSALRRRYPRQLSGGEQQRVAIGRVLVLRPRLLLFDEPLSNLDAKLRKEMRYELKRLQRQVGITTIYVTHDQEEAMAISDRIGVMRDGRLEQLGTPTDVYDAPATRFVADFIGVTNFLSAKVVSMKSHDATLLAGELAVTVRLPDHVSPPTVGTKQTIAVRPENLRLSSVEEVGAKCRGRVVSTVKLGPIVEIRVAIADGQHVLVHATGQEWLVVPAPGQGVAISWRSDAWFLV